MQTREWTNVTRLQNGNYNAELDGLLMFIAADETSGDYRDLMAWIAAGGEVVDALEPLAYPTQADAERAMTEWADAFALQITGIRPDAEKLSWSDKEKAAEHYQAGTATANDLAMLQAEAGLTSETLDDLAASILANAALFRVVVGKIAGFRRQTKAALEAATPEQYPAILTAAKAAALADAAAMGLPVVL